MNSCRRSCPTALSLHSAIVVSAMYINNINNVRNRCPCYLRNPALIDGRSIMKHVSWRSCDWETAQRFGGLECLLLQVEQQLWCILFFPSTPQGGNRSVLRNICVFNLIRWTMSKIVDFLYCTQWVSVRILGHCTCHEQPREVNKSRDFLAGRMGVRVMYIFRKLQNALRWDKAARLS